MKHDIPDPIERHCERCGKLLARLTYDPKTNIWSGTSIRHIDSETPQYRCRDCDEPDISPKEKKPKATAMSKGEKARNCGELCPFRPRVATNTDNPTLPYSYHIGRHYEAK